MKSMIKTGSRDFFCLQNKSFTFWKILVAAIRHSFYFEGQRFLFALLFFQVSLQLSGVQAAGQGINVSLLKPIVADGRYAL